MQALAPGQRLQNDQYKVLKRLGVGGQGTAYLCRDQLNNCDIVLKETIVPAYADRSLREQALKGFEKEAKILESLDCDGIVKLKDYFFEDHRGYIGLEHINGHNLRQLIEANGAIGEERARLLARQMCQILAYLHERSIIHRDFTPDNLILTDDDKLKLIDFNVAQVQQVGTTGTIAGKHSYLPPEQFRGKATSQSDIYALGATLHFLTTGKDPEAISQSSPLEAGAQTSQSFDQIVRSCTALDLNKRFKTVADITYSLDRKTDHPVHSIALEAGKSESENDRVTIKVSITEQEKIQA
jgi:serine/threonine-protein kinase